MRLALVSGLLWCLAATAADAAGIQEITVPSGDGSAPLRGAVWYPCAVPPATVSFRGIDMPGTKDCPVAGEALPLIVISHGGRGWFGGHRDTAAALADAGYVVAAVTHPDEDRRRWRSERPAAIKGLIDHMLTAWPAHARLDPERIGVFGFSRGGYTGLVLIGGEPQFWRLLWHCLWSGLWSGSDPMCQSPPDAKAEDEPEPSQESTEDSPGESGDRTYVHDPRIKAAVIAAPVGVVFSQGGLENVTVPVQLWRAENDELLLYPDHADAVARKLPVEPDYRVVPEAGHFAFMAPCGAVERAAAPRICSDAPGFDRAGFHRTFNADIRAFFDEHLGDP